MEVDEREGTFNKQRPAIHILNSFVTLELLFQVSISKFIEEEGTVTY